MPVKSIKLIGKSILGELGFCQVPEKMGSLFSDQLIKIESAMGEVCPFSRHIMTSMTGTNEIKLTEGAYFPKIRNYDISLHKIFSPVQIFANCNKGLDEVYPGSDFIIWNSMIDHVYATTFSREAPILAFESTTGMKALGVILRPSLLKFGDYVFETIAQHLHGDITVTLVTCNHYEYPEGSMPSIISGLANKYGMECIIPEDSNSEKNPECYHRGESGNHVVAMW